MEDMMEACWGGVTQLMVVSGDAEVGRIRNGSHVDRRATVFLALFSLSVHLPFFPFLSLSSPVIPPVIVIAGMTHSFSV